MNDFFDLPIEAQAVACAWFSMAAPGSGSYLRFAMVENKPTALAQKGLDALVERQFISQAKDKQSGAITYKPLKNMRPFANALIKRISGHVPPPGFDFRLVEPVDP